MISRGSSAGERTLWLADHHLADLVGHHYEYNRVLAHSAYASGWDTIVLCRKGYSFPPLPHAVCAGIFRPDWRHSPPLWAVRHWRILEALEHLSRRRFLADLKRGLKKKDFRKGDVVLAQMLAPRHLEGWLRWILDCPLDRCPSLALHLGYDPTRFAGHAGLAEALRMLRDSRHAGFVHFVTDSERMVPRYAEILQGNVHALPHVVPVETVPTKPSSDESGIVFACLGNPRREKGFVDIAQAIELVVRTPSASHARFLVQAHAPDPASREAVARLRDLDSPQVELIEDRLDADRYAALMARTHVVLLPYHLDAYKDRTSGVFCEAMVTGRAVVVSQGSWMDGELARLGVGWVIPERDASRLAESIRQAVTEWPLVREKAAELAPASRAHFSGKNFLTQLISISDATI